MTKQIKLIFIGGNGPRDDTHTHTLSRSESRDPLLLIHTIRNVIKHKLEVIVYTQRTKLLLSLWQSSLSL